jgi:hypothetical protein
MSGDMVSAERRYLVSVSAPTPSIPAPFHHQQACLFPRGSAATPVTHWGAHPRAPGAVGQSE